MALQAKMPPAMLPAAAVTENNMRAAIGRTRELKGDELSRMVRDDLDTYIKEFGPNLTVKDFQVCVDELALVLDNVITVSVSSRGDGSISREDAAWRPADVHAILTTLQQFFGSMEGKEVLAVTVDSLEMYSSNAGAVKNAARVFPGIFGFGLRRFALKSTQDYNLTDRVDGTFFCTFGLRYARTTLTSLSLQGTGLGASRGEIGESMFETLCETVLRDNMTLRHLDLADNFLEDSDATLLVEQRMPALLSLSLDDNLVTPDIIPIISTALEKRRFGLAELSVAKNFVLEPTETWAFVSSVMDLMRNVMYVDMRGAYMDALTSEQMDTLAQHSGLCLFLTRGGFDWLYTKQRNEMHMVLVPGDYDTGANRGDARKWLDTAYVYAPGKTLRRLTDPDVHTEVITQVTLLTRDAELVRIVMASPEFRTLFPAVRVPPPSLEAAPLPTTRRLLCPDLKIPAPFLRAPLTYSDAMNQPGLDLEGYQWKDYWHRIQPEGDVRVLAMQTRVLCVYQESPPPLGGGSYQYASKVRLVMRLLLDLPTTGPLGSLTVTFEDPDENERSFCRVQDGARGDIISGLLAFCHHQLLELIQG